VARLRRASDGPTAARLSGVATGLFVAVYAIFASTPLGRALDADVLRHHLEGVWDRMAELVAALVSPPTTALAVVVLVWVAYRSGRPADGIRAAALVAASAALAAALEAVLGSLDPLRAEAARELGRSFYPSGHAAVAMSLSLAALIVAPARSRPTVMLAAGVWSSVSGWVIFATRSHHPSDVLGGFLLALALAGIAAVRRPQRDEAAPQGRSLPGTRIAAVLGAMAATALILEPARLLSIPLGPLEPALLLAGVVLSAAAFLIVSAFTRVLEGERVRGAS
jgi:membrane-associated phospholipid phosphatase